MSPFRSDSKSNTYIFSLCIFLKEESYILNIVPFDRFSAAFYASCGLAFLIVN